MAKKVQNGEGSKLARFIQNDEGAVGYIAAWLVGVPASVLFVIFLLRGCN